MEVKNFRPRFKKTGSYARQTLKVCFILLCLLVIGAQHVFAATIDDFNSITNNTPFYQPDQCTTDASDTSSDSGSVNTANNIPDSEIPGNGNQQKIWNYLIALGFTPVQAAGIYGNIGREGVFDPESIENGDEQWDPQLHKMVGRTNNYEVFKKLTAKGEDGFGLIGFTPGLSLMEPNINGGADWSGISKVDVTKDNFYYISTQLNVVYGYMKNSTVNGKNMLQAYQDAATSPAAAANAFQDYVENAGVVADSVRDHFANSGMNKFGGGSGGASQFSLASDTSGSDSSGQSGQTCCNTTSTNAGASDVPITGDLQALAQQVMQNKNITFDYGDSGKVAANFQRMANGQEAQTDDGRHVNVQPILLVALLYLAQHHKVQVSSLTDGPSHTSPDNPHGMGDAMDIDFLDGKGTNGSDAVAQEIMGILEQVLPSGSRFGNGNGGTSTIQADGKTFTTFDDAPNHVHFDVVGVDQDADDAAVAAAQGISGNGTSSGTDASGSSATCCDTASVSGPAGSGPLFGITFPQVSDTADLANRINQYVQKTQPSSPFVNSGADFVAAGEKYNVNPAMEIGFAYKESSLGINQPSNSHDAWGLTEPGDASDYPFINGIVNFPSWTVGIYEATKYTGTTYTAPNAPLHSTSVYELMTHYTPGTAAEQTAITLNVMHQILDGISTSAGSASPSSDTSAISYTPAGDSGDSGCANTATTPQVNIIKHDVFGNGDGLMGHQPTMIGLHYTEGNPQTPDDVVSMLKDPSGTKGCNHVTHSCSVQLTIDPKGNVYQLTSRLDVITENIINFNNADIGIEIMGSGPQALLNNQQQFNAVVATVVQLMNQYNIQEVEDFENKAGLMGHFECDNWSQDHLGQHFQGTYKGDVVESTDNHQDPGAAYMSKVRDAVKQAMSGSSAITNQQFGQTT